MTNNRKRNLDRFDTGEKWVCRVCLVIIICTVIFKIAEKAGAFK